jgi:anti-anti-sigma factor
MLIVVRCPNGHVLHVKDKHAGRMGVCPRCSAPIRVPLPDQAHGDDRIGVVPASQRPSEAVVLKGPRHDGADQTSATGPPIFFSPLEKGKLCLECGKIVSQSFTICPRCGTPISTYRHLVVRKEGDAIIIQFSEHRILDQTIVKEVAEELCNVAERSHDIVLSLSKVLALSSSMLGRLVMLQKKLELKKRQLKLRDVGAEVREVLAATKLDQVLRVDEGQ